MEVVYNEHTCYYSLGGVGGHQSGGQLGHPGGSGHHSGGGQSGQQPLPMVNILTKAMVETSPDEQNLNYSQVSLNNCIAPFYQG